jgi:protease I
MIGRNMRVAILLEDNYHVLEAWYPYLRLREEGIKTIFVGTRKNQFTSKEGYATYSEASIDRVDPEKYDGVIIPGGYAPDILRRNKDVVDFVRLMFRQKKLVAAICHAGWVLVSANVLRGKKATCFFAIKDDIINAGADYLDKDVVVDGNLVTSRFPDDLPAFCREILKFLKEQNSIL